ncbi:MAG: GTP-binding protein [Candidatus Diapherotrites archaeon]|nr:GTP-binding protein [Candidatus Diapherotrites archaeon]
MVTEDKIRQLEEEIKKTQYNKATEKHIGLLKARIARLKERLEKKQGGGGGKQFAVKKAGDATVVMLGFPSVGKSTLLNQLTSAESDVGEYEFTTIGVIPGMMKYKGARIQLLDVPGIIEGASRGKGHGKQVLSVVRNADLLLVLIDGPGQFDKIISELHKAGVRVNQRPPDVKLSRKRQGGIKLSFTYPVDEETHNFYKKLVLEYGICNAELTIRERITPDQLIDVLTKNRRYLPALVVLNKSDVSSYNGKEIELKISAKEGRNLDELKERIFMKLGLTRIFMKKVGAEPDMEEPMILRGNPTVRDLCKKLHKDFLRNFMFAKVWGPSARFESQRVGLEHKLKDKDIVEIHVKR